MATISRELCSWPSSSEINESNGTRKYSIWNYFNLFTVLKDSSNNHVHVVLNKLKLQAWRDTLKRNIIPGTGL